MTNLSLSQDELKIIVGILQQVQLTYKDSLIVNQVIVKLDSYIDKPKPEQVPVTPVAPEKPSTDKPSEPQTIIEPEVINP